MNPVRVVLSILFFIFGFTIGISQTGVIRGKVVAEIKAEFDFIKENVQVLICTGCEEFSTHLDENLYFEFHNVRPGAFEIWIEPHSIYSYDFKSGNLKKDEILEIEIPVAFSCIYDQSDNDKTCPICHKQNRVIPVAFGLLSYTTENITIWDIYDQTVIPIGIANETKFYSDLHTAQNMALQFMALFV